MAKEMSAMAKDIALKEALNNGLIKKVEALESELDRRKEELAAGKAREVGWEKEFKKAAEEKEELFDVIDKKDKYFEEMRAELNESLNHIK
jgi:enoyl-CoA hydratase/carnithine racemase